MKPKGLASSKTRGYPPPSREEHFDFLIRCYFGGGTDPLRLCVHRAYLDLNRTLHGFAKLKRADDLRESGIQCVIGILKSLYKTKIRSQREFDNWHKTACIRLRALYHKQGFALFSIGQAQKWVNMSMKYAFTLGERRLKGFASLYRFAHIPIDNILLKKVAALGVLGRASLLGPWSRLDDYATYLTYQKRFRDHFAGSIPLAVEFRLWLQPL
jgi:hypothetical protein